MSLEWRFQVVFDSQERRGVALSRYKHEAKPSSSTPRHAYIKDTEERKWMKTFWFRNRGLFGPKFTVRSERNVFLPLFLVSFFFFFFCRTFSWKTPVSYLREQHQFRTRSVGQAWPGTASTVRKKECLCSPNNASAPKSVPCHAECVLCLSR